MTAGAAIPPIVVLLAVAFPRPTGEPQAMSEHLESLVRAERAFARSARQNGASAAFVQVLAADGLVFNPRPVNGRELHASGPIPEEAVLAWHPRVAAVSAAGNLGYTSGPYLYRPSPDAEPVGYGHYFSVWQRASTDDPWELALDMGTPHGRVGDEEEEAEEVSEFPSVEATSSSWSREEAAEELRAAAERLNGVLDGGTEASLEDVALEGVRVYRTGMVPGVGRDVLAERAGVGAGEPSRTWDVRDVWVGGGSDLGIVWGGWEVGGGEGGEADQPRRGNWVEVWVVRDGGWRLGALVLHEWGG